MKKLSRNSLPVVAALALALAVRASRADNTLNIPYLTGTTYTQNFNSLWTNGASPPVNYEPDFSPATIGAPKVGSLFPVIDLTGPSVDLAATIDHISSMTGWYANNFGGNSVQLKYDISDGSNSGLNATANATAALYALYNPAVQTPGNNNTALGLITASETGNVVFGARFINNGSTNLNAITLSAIGQLFHQDTGAKSLKFGYKIGAAADPIPTTSGLTLFGGLNVGGFAVGTTPGPVVQSAASTQNLSVVDLPLASNWAPGQSLWITWQMGTGGSGQGLSIDDLSFSARSIVTAGTVAWNLPGSGTWDTATPNWSGASTTFANGTYNVTFGTLAANATITVQNGGVTLPQSVTITNTNTASTYTFVGGAIGGGFGAGVTIAGGGTVKFTVPNTYGLATNVNAGTLIIDNDNQLGNNSVGIVGALLNLNGGTLQLAANYSSTLRPLTVTAAGATLNTNGFNATFAGDSINAVTIQGALHVTGGGNLTLGAQPTFGTTSGKLVIDAGNSVTILGNSRSSPSDMYDGGIINGTLILKSTALGARYNFNSQGVSNTSNSFNGVSKITGAGEIQVPTGSGWTDIGTGSIHNWIFDSNGVCISNTSASYAAEIAVNIHLNPLADSDPAGHPYHRLDVTTANFIGAANPNAANAFGVVLGATKNGTQGHGVAFSNLIVSGVISGHADINIGNDYKSGGSGDLTLLAHNTWDGVTLINGGGALYIGIDDALPTSTDIIFGAFAGAPAGSVDLAGHNQHVRSIETANGANSPSANIINNSGTTDATLFVTGDITPFYPYTAQINDGGTTALGVVNTHKTALVKSGAGTLILGIYQASIAKSSSNYSGGTTVSGGTLQIAFDGALGAPAGPITFDGGTVSVKNSDLQYDNSTTHETSASWTTSRLITVSPNGGTINTPAFTPVNSGAGAPSLVASLVFTGAGGYNWAGPLHLTGAAGSTTALNGGAGAVTVTPAASILIDPAISFTAGGATDPFTDTVATSLHVSIQNNGALTIAAGTKSLAALTGAGNTTVAPAAALSVSQLSQNSLTLNGNAAIRAAAAPVASTLSALTLAADTSNTFTSRLELNNNPLILNTSSNKPATLAMLQSAISQGVTGTHGITSASTLADPTHKTTVAIDNALLNLTTFYGQQVDTTSLLALSTWLGDTNLDRKVNVTDLGTLATFYGTAVPNGPLQGDFNNDGLVNVTDLGLLATNYGQGTAPNATFPLESDLAQFPQLASTAQIPEPTSLLLLTIPLLLSFRHNRPRQRP